MHKVREPSPSPTATMARGPNGPDLVPNQDQMKPAMVAVWTTWTTFFSFCPILSAGLLFLFIFFIKKDKKCGPYGPRGHHSGFEAVPDLVINWSMWYRCFF